MPPPYGQPPHYAAPPLQDIRICPGCGIIAPFARQSCNVCNAPFAAAPVAPGRIGSMLFACIHACDFACTACGKRSPLATIDIDGQVECMCCGLSQRFDVVQWTDALGHAHDVADLSGPNPDGQNSVPGRPIAGRSMHAKIGTEYTSSTKTQSSMIMDGQGTRTHSLRTTVSPGHPLCKTCRTPLEVSIDGSGITHARCPRCNETATYALPANATSVCGALRGMIAGEQRTDRPVARTVRGQGGGEAVVCPQCGAALAAGEGEMVKCTFCNMTARVPGKLARRQRQGEPPPMVPFWVVLDGISPGRKKLLAGKSEDDDDDDDDDDHLQVQVHPPGYGPPGFAQGGAPSWAHPTMQRQMQHGQPPKKSMAGIVAIVAIVVTLVIVAAVVGGVIYSNLPDEAPTPAKTKPATPRRK